MLPCLNVSDYGESRRVSGRSALHQTFLSSSATPSLVRKTLTVWLDERQVDEEPREDLVLAVSEAVTNAITHGESPVTVAVSWSGGQLRVEVHDRSRFMPAPWPVIDSADAETGRGLLLVDTLAADWGFYRTPGGKAVYFTLECAERQ